MRLLFLCIFVSSIGYSQEISQLYLAYSTSIIDSNGDPVEFMTLSEKTSKQKALDFISVKDFDFTLDLSNTEYINIDSAQKRIINAPDNSTLNWFKKKKLKNKFNELSDNEVIFKINKFDLIKNKKLYCEGEILLYKSDNLTHTIKITYPSLSGNGSLAYKYILDYFYSGYLKCFDHFEKELMIEN